MVKVPQAATMVVLVLGIAACGGSSKSTATHAHTPPAARLHATLTAPNHSPVAGKIWPYSVHVTDASGRPLSGTVTVQFAFGGQVVGHDTPPTHPLKNGRWHDNLQFPRRSVGFPLTFQVVVHTSAGSVTLKWPVSVKP